MEQVSGIETVAAMIDLPRSRGVSNTEFTIDGREQPLANEEPTADWQAVNPEYFSALGVPVSSGRTLADTERTDTQLVAVVNERFVEVFLSPLDSTIRQKSRFCGTLAVVLWSLDRKWLPNVRIVSGAHGEMARRRG